MKKYDCIFLDRDGTINSDSGYISTIKDFKLYDFTIPALKKLARFGNKFCIITNQSGVNRGLIKKEDLINASLLLKKNKKKIVLPVTEYSAPIEWSFKMSKRNKLLPHKKNFYKIRSQDLPKSYHDTGNFVGIPIHHFRKKNIDFDKHYVGLKIPKNRSVDIDDLEDWKIAERLYR